MDAETIQIKCNSPENHIYIVTFVTLIPWKKIIQTHKKLYVKVVGWFEYKIKIQHRTKIFAIFICFEHRMGGYLENHSIVFKNWYQSPNEMWLVTFFHVHVVL